MVTCYMCEKEKTSVEHVPPKCLFPEKKDAEGIDYRINLITVPSCDVHNMATSKDDEYLMAVVVSHFENNAVAHKHAGTKVLRSLIKNNGSLARRILDGSRPASVNEQETRALKIETKRIYGEIEKIGRALHFKHFGKKWLDPVWVATTSIISDDPSFAPDAQKLKSLNKAMFDRLPRNGENPDVFYYQITPEEELPLAGIRLVFYSGFEAVVVTKVEV